MLPSLIARPFRAALIVILIAAIGAGIWAWHRAGQSTEVSEAAAIASFRRQGGAAPAPGVPASGVYSYAVTGSEEGGLGPAHLARALPPVARYVVSSAPGGYREELSLSAEHVEGATLSVTTEGTRELARRTKVTFLGFGQDDRRTLQPPPLRLPARLSPGAEWSGAYRAGDLPIAFRSRATGREAVTVAGHRYETWIIRTVSDTGGVHPGVRTDTRWWSPGLALALRWTIDMQIGGPASLTTHADLRLESAVPRT